MENNPFMFETTNQIFFPIIVLKSCGWMPDRDISRATKVSMNCTDLYLAYFRKGISKFGNICPIFSNQSWISNEEVASIWTPIPPQSRLKTVDFHW